MANEETIIIVSFKNLRDAAAKIVVRVEENGGNISENDVLEEVAKTIRGNGQNWKVFLQNSISFDEGVEKAVVSDQLQGRAEMNEGLIESSSSFRDTKVIAISRARMLRLAEQWRDHLYPNYNNRTAVFVFRDVGIFEFELVCIADLLEAAMSGNPPHYVDSAYRLLRDWRGQGKNPFSLCSRFMEYQMDDFIYELSYTVPLNPSTQIDMILDIWAHLKFELISDLEDPEQIWIDLLHELGWVEDESRNKRLP